MMDLIARLANRHGRVMVLCAVVVAAVAAFIGAPVVTTLTGGNPDFVTPGSGSVRADDRIGAATGIQSDGGIIALVDTGAPVDDARTREEVDKVAGLMAGDQTFADVLTYYRTQDKSLVSNDGQRTIVVEQAQGQRGGPLPGRRRPAVRPAGRRRRGQARRQRGGRQPGRQHRPARSGAGRTPRLPGALPALAVDLPQSGGLGAAAGHRRSERRADPVRAAGGRPVHPDVDLLAQPGHRARPRPRHRLQPADRLPLPQRDDGRARHRPGDPGHPAHRGTHHPVQLAHRERRDGLAVRLPPALPVLDGGRRPAGLRLGAAGRAAGAARDAATARPATSTSWPRPGSAARWRRRRTPTAAGSRWPAVSCGGPRWSRSAPERCWCCSDCRS